MIDTSTGAQALVKQWWADQGLEALGDWAWQKILAGESEDQIVIEARQTGEYKARYPAMEALAKSGRGISETAYRAYEDMVRTTSHAWGFPTGMYDTAESIANMLIKGVSPGEFNSRIQLAAAASFTAPDSTRLGFMQMGVTPGQFVSLYADADKSLPMLQRQFQAAQIIGAGLEQGVQVDNAEAARLSQGFDPNASVYDTAKQNLGQVASTAGLGGGFGETVDTNERVAAAFGETPAQTKQIRVVKSRQAAFQGGGSAAGSSGGVSGLGDNSL